MNWDQVKGNWKQLTGKVKEKWGKLTDDDLTTAAGKRDQILGLLQQTLDEEAAADWKLTLLAQNINVEAQSPA